MARERGPGLSHHFFAARHPISRILATARPSARGLQGKRGGFARRCSDTPDRYVGRRYPNAKRPGMSLTRAPSNYFPGAALSRTGPQRVQSRSKTPGRPRRKGWRLRAILRVSILPSAIRRKAPDPRLVPPDCGRRMPRSAPESAGFARRSARRPTERRKARIAIDSLTRNWNSQALVAATCTRVHLRAARRVRPFVRSGPGCRNRAPIFPSF